MPRSKWSNEDTSLVMRLHKAKLSFAEIAKLVKRTDMAVAMLIQRQNEQRRYRRKEMVRTITQRPCLRCRNPFPSEGAHHRICQTCRDTTVGVLAEIPTPFLGGYTIS